MSQRHVVEARGLACGYGGTALVEHLDFCLKSGSVTCLLGPNGAGKTTLLKTLLGFVPPVAGAVLVDGEDTACWKRRRYGQMFGYIPQTHVASFSFTVMEVVLMGRTPSLGATGATGEEDERVAWQALRDLGLEAFAERDYTQLSGGERQMVLVARALAQQPAFLVMDEPTSALDLGNQAKVLERILDLAQRGYGVLLTTHDPNQAFLLDGEVLCLQGDGTMLQGRAGEVLSEAVLSGLYGRDVRVEARRVAGREMRSCLVPLEWKEGEASC